MSLDLITVNKSSNELWVRLRIAMKENGSKCTGWVYIPGDHDHLYERRPKSFKSLRPVVDEHIANRNWLPIYTHYGEHAPIVEVNAHHIKSYSITNRVFMIPVEIWEAEEKAQYERNLAMRGEKNGD